MYKAVNRATGATVGTGFTKEQALAMNANPIYRRSVVFKLENPNLKNEKEENGLSKAKAPRKDKEAVTEEQTS